MFTCFFKPVCLPVFVLFTCLFTWLPVVFFFLTCVCFLFSCLFIYLSWLFTYVCFLFTYVCSTFFCFACVCFLLLIILEVFVFDCFTMFRALEAVVRATVAAWWAESTCCVMSLSSRTNRLLLWDALHTEDKELRNKWCVFSV